MVIKLNKGYIFNNMDDTSMEAGELLIELELIRDLLVKNNVYIDSEKVLEVMDSKDIRNTHDAIFDLYGVNVSEILSEIKEAI